MSLNLCCISINLKEQGYNFQTITYKRFNQLGRVEGLRTLSERILNNVLVNQKTIEYCAENNWGYRLSSSLFPLISFDKANIKLNELKDYDKIIEILSESGKTAKTRGVRLSSHPCEFTTLDSNDEAAILRSVTDLELHGLLHDALGLPKDYSNPINIHLKNEHIDFDTHNNRINNSLNLLSSSVRDRLVFENNDKGRWNCSTLFKHYAQKMPLTYDNLHDAVNPSEEFDSFNRFRETWKSNKPLFHYSEGRPDNKRAHRDFPENHLEFFMGERQSLADYDIELKMKDLAIKIIA